MTVVRVICGWLVLCISATAGATPLGSVTIVQELAGVQVSIPIDLDLEATTTNAGLELKVTADANLAALQSNFSQMVGSFELPNDNCPQYGQHPVARLKSSSLGVEGSKAIVKIKARVAMWDCQKGVPGGGTTVEWRNKCVRILGKRMCTKVPHKVTIQPGPDIKNKLIEDDVDATVSFAAATKDGKSIELIPSNIDVDLHNDITKFINAIAGMLNSSAAQHAKRQIGQLVDAGVLRQAIPAEVLVYEPNVTSISFYPKPDNSLALKASFTAVLTGEQLNRFMKDALE